MNSASASCFFAPLCWNLLFSQFQHFSDSFRICIQLPKTGRHLQLEKVIRNSTECVSLILGKKTQGMISVVQLNLESRSRKTRL